MRKKQKTGTKLKDPSFFWAGGAVHIRGGRLIEFGRLVFKAFAFDPPYKDFVQLHGVLLDGDGSVVDRGKLFVSAREEMTLDTVFHAAWADAQFEPV